MKKFIEKKWFFLNENRWNNSFWFVQWKEIWVPGVKIWDVEDLQLWDRIVFSDIDNWELVQSIGLNVHLWILSGQCPVFVSDNHNRSLEAWSYYKSSNLKLVHIDQHRDESDYWDVLDYEKDLRVCDYIKWAKDQNWIQENHISLCETKDFENFDKYIRDFRWECFTFDFILNIDLDIFAPEQTLISHNRIWEIISKLSTKASLITVAMSPLFIDQKMALDLAKKFLKMFLKK